MVGIYSLCFMFFFCGSGERRATILLVHMPSSQHRLPPPAAAASSSFNEGVRRTKYFASIVARPDPVFVTKSTLAKQIVVV